MAAQGFTGQQRKAMLEGINKHEGSWANLDPESEIERIGKAAGLDKEVSFQLFNSLVDEDCIDLGRSVQAGPVVGGAKPKGGTTSYGMLYAISYDMGLTGKGRAEIGR